jgi:hypothetical protein
LPGAQTTPGTQTAPASNSPAQTGTNANTPGGTQQAAQPQGHEKLITSFHLLLNPEVIGTVDQTNYTVKLNVPYGTDLQNLTPSIVISPSAIVSPAYNAPQNFVNPVTYTVMAQDGTSQKYTVTVNVLAEASKQPSKSNPWILIVVILIITLVVIAAVILLVLRRIKRTK